MSYWVIYRKYKITLMNLGYVIMYSHIIILSIFLLVHRTVQQVKNIFKSREKTLKIVKIALQM